MSQSKEAGDVLEYAVHRIEEVLLQKHPGLKGAHAVIERNKIIRTNGIRNEVDVWVQVHPNTHYEAVHIIESKNWKNEVGLREVDALVKKMTRLGAASAALIARKFTRDAKAAVAAERRVSLVRFSNNFWSPLDTLLCAATTHVLDDAKLGVHFRHPSPASSGKLHHKAGCRLRGVSTDLREFISPQIDQHFEKIQQRDRSRYQLKGRHPRRTRFYCEFEKGEFFIGADEVKGISVVVDYVLWVRHLKIVAQFNIEGRGGFVRLMCPEESADLPEVAIEVVTLASDFPEKEPGRSQQ